MQRFTDQGWQKINDLAQRYQVSTDAVVTMLDSVVRGNGTMAQFYHSELGGGGQWMQGGMTMVGDMFNYGLKSKVDGLCSELAQLLLQQPFVPQPPSHQSQWQGGGQQSGDYGAGSGSGGSPVTLFVAEPSGGSGNWWPAELGSPNGSGGQNHARYAYFSNARRLAVEVNGAVTVYDTLDHQIGGVSQQQSGSGSITLTSQYGTVDVGTLPIVSMNGIVSQSVAQPSASQARPSNPPFGANVQETDIFATIERLAKLHQNGILSTEEFANKKAELLSRL